MNISSFGEQKKILSVVSDGGDNASASKFESLVTCYPFNSIGSAPKRFIVSAERMPDRRQ